MARGTRAATRERLLEAASTVFSERGYAGTSVDAIAEAAGMTTGALYSNFSGKREIFLTALRHAAGQPDGPAPAQPAEAAAASHAASGHRFLESLDSNPAGMRLLLWAVLEADRDREVAELVGAVVREQRDIQAEFLATTPKGDQPEWVAGAAVGLSALAIGFAVQHMLSPQDVPTELANKVLDRAIDLLATAQF